MAATAVRPETPRRVLVVEDDHAICEVLSDLLDAEGFQTLCVSTDREAYSAIPTLPAFEALLVDVNLGHGTTGFDVARFGRQVLPNLPVIYVSGQASEESFKVFGVPDSRFVAKPFTGRELLAVVHETLASQG